MLKIKKIFMFLFIIYCLILSGCPTDPVEPQDDPKKEDKEVIPEDNNDYDDGDDNNDQNITRPVSPTNLYVEAASKSTIVLTWSDNADNEMGYKIFRSTTNTNNFTSPIIILQPDSVRYTDSNLSANTKYYYWIIAYNSAGNSNYINGNDTTFANNAPVLSGPSTANGAFWLTWTYNWEGPLVSTSDHYQLQMSTTSADSGFTTIYYSPYNNRTTPYSYNITPPNSGTYYYRVRAYTYNGLTDYSNVISVNYMEPVSSDVTLTPTYDNLLMYSSTDSSCQNTVYSNSYLIAGQNFAIGAWFSSCLSGMSTIKYNLPSTLNNKTIVKAELRLYVHTLPADLNTTYKIAAIYDSWNTDTITYSNQPNIYTSYQSSVDPPVTTAVPVKFDVTNIVQNWVNGSWYNNGFMIWDPNIIYPSITSYRATEFYSADVSTPSLRPQLYIEYE